MKKLIEFVILIAVIVLIAYGLKNKYFGKKATIENKAIKEKSKNDSSFVDYVTGNQQIKTYKKVKDKINRAKNKHNQQINEALED